MYTDYKHLRITLLKMCIRPNGGAGDRGDPAPHGARREQPRLRLGLRPRRRGALPGARQGERGAAETHRAGSCLVLYS